jgi:hypothetical protein
MSAPTTPPWLLNATRRRNTYSAMRISDAERSEVADLLSKHYGDGRLDQEEFNQRMDQAMRAKTYADLSDLFVDLPRTETEVAEAPRAGHPRRGHTRLPGAVFLVVVVIVVASVAGHVLAWTGSIWLWALLLGAIIYAAQARRKAS